MVPNMTPPPRSTILIGFLGLVLVGACSDDTSTTSGSGDEALAVVASFYPLAEAAERVGGDRVSVTNLTPAGAEPHDLELDPDQADEVEDAAVVLVLGRGFQPAVEEAAERRDDTTVELLRELDLPGDDDEARDPHVWLDPALMMDVVDEVAAALSETEPGAASTFEANADAFKAEIGALDTAFEEGLATCRRRTIVVAHDAFGRLAGRYDLTQEPIAGISPDQEPDPARLAELADVVARDGTTTVFTETLVSTDVADTLAREANVETAVLDPLEGLTEEDQRAGADYVTVMQDNLEQLRTALDCS